MTTSPRDALDRLVAAYQTLADAFETYDNALYDTFDEVTPFELVEEGDEDFDDEDDEDDDLEIDDELDDDEDDEEEDEEEEDDELDDSPAGTNR